MSGSHFESKLRGGSRYDQACSGLMDTTISLWVIIYRHSRGMRGLSIYIIPQVFHSVPDMFLLPSANQFPSEGQSQDMLRARTLRWVDTLQLYDHGGTSMSGFL